MMRGLFFSFFVFFLIASLSSAVTAKEGLTYTFPAERLNFKPPLPESLRFCGGGALPGTFPITSISSFDLVPGEQAFVAVSDKGYGYTGRFDIQGDILKGVSFETETSLLGDTLKGSDKADVDVEAVLHVPETTAPGGAYWYMSFERHHRLWRYSTTEKGLSRDVSFTAPLPISEDAAAEDAGNRGYEAFAYLPEGRFVLVGEHEREVSETPGGKKQYFTTLLLGRPGAWEERLYPLEDDYRATDAKTLPNGDILLLERHFSPMKGFPSRLMRLPQSELSKDVAEPVVPQFIADLSEVVDSDNLEDLAIYPLDENEVMLLLATDDDGRLWQKTFITALCYRY